MDEWGGAGVTAVGKKKNFMGRSGSFFRVRKHLTSWGLPTEPGPLSYFEETGGCARMLCSLRSFERVRARKRGPSTNCSYISFVNGFVYGGTRRYGCANFKSYYEAAMLKNGLRARSRAG